MRVSKYILTIVCAFFLNASVTLLGGIEVGVGEVHAEGIPRESVSAPSFKPGAAEQAKQELAAKKAGQKNPPTTTEPADDAETGVPRDDAGNSSADLAQKNVEKALEQVELVEQDLKDKLDDAELDAKSKKWINHYFSKVNSLKKVDYLTDLLPPPDKQRDYGVSTATTKLNSCGQSLEVAMVQMQNTFTLLEGQLALKKTNKKEFRLTHGAKKIARSCDSAAKAAEVALKQCPSMQISKTLNFLTLANDRSTGIVNAMQTHTTESQKTTNAMGLMKKSLEHLGQAGEHLKASVQEVAYLKDNVKRTREQVKACNNGFTKFFLSLKNKCVDNKGKCIGLGVGTAAVLYGIKRYRDGEKEKDKEDDAEKAAWEQMVAKNSRIESIASNCLTDMNYTAEVCKGPLAAYCAADPSATNCGQFSEFYCGTASSVNPPGHDTDYCNDNRDKVFCEDTNNAGAPTCLQLSIASNPLCEEDPSKCAPAADMEELCNKYVGDPLCTDYAQDQVAAHLQNNVNSDSNTTTAPVTNTGAVSSSAGNTGVFSSALGGYTQSSALSSTGTSDVVGEHSADPFTALSSMTKQECNNGALTGCYQKTRTPASK